MDPQHSAQDVLLCDLCETLAAPPPLPYVLWYLSRKTMVSCVGVHLSDQSKDHKAVPFEKRGTTTTKCQKLSTKILTFFVKNAMFQYVHSVFPLINTWDTKPLK